MKTKQETPRRPVAGEKSLDGGAAPSPEEKSAVLKARARVLAREPEEDTGPQESIEIIEFRLGGETYGIASAFVREVYPLKDFTPLPGTQAFVLGIMNVRGQILSVVDIKAFFNLPQKGLGDLNKVIILGDGLMEFGIVADQILGAHGIATDSIMASPAAVSGIGAEYLKGITGEGVIILDAQAILDDKEMIVQQEA
jgi:purine-binding chemotaxis protein CheW